MLPLFEPRELVTTGRVVLSALDTSPDYEAMAWLDAALEPEWTRSDLEGAREGSHAVLISDLSETAVGLALVRRDSPQPADATISFLAVDPARRFRGLGGEAGLALERHLRDRLDVQRVYAGVPEGRGLAVYFWLRLGYRPLSAAEAPPAPLGLSGESLPGIWMLRGNE